MRDFCWACHRPQITCFCSMTRPFATSAEFVLVVHPDEFKSTVGTAWILRRSISNSRWIRSYGADLDRDPAFLDLFNASDVVPLLLFPGPRSLNLSEGSDEAWKALVPSSKRPVFIVVDGTWNQARKMLNQSRLLRSLPRVSFETTRPSEYGFKQQPHPDCLSSVEGVHRVVEILAERNWGTLPPLREHDQMIEIFRKMVRFQLQQVS